jgi:hypothetical protein
MTTGIVRAACFAALSTGPAPAATMMSSLDRLPGGPGEHAQLVIPVQANRLPALPPSLCPALLRARHELPAPELGPAYLALPGAYYSAVPAV